MSKRLIFIGCVAAQNFIWYNVTGKKRWRAISMNLRKRIPALLLCLLMLVCLVPAGVAADSYCANAVIFERLHKLLTTDVPGVLTVYTLDRGDVASSHSYLLMKDDAKRLSDLLAEYVGE